MPDIDATVAGATANSFVTLDEADAYLDTVSSEWEDETDDDLKARKLIDCSRIVSSYPYEGSRATATQALSWPRVSAPNPDGVSDWATFDEDVIPQRVKDAVCELALEAVRAETADEGDVFGVPDPAVKREKVGPIETEYFESGATPTGLTVSSRALSFLSPLLALGLRRS